MDAIVRGAAYTVRPLQRQEQHKAHLQFPEVPIKEGSMRPIPSSPAVLPATWAQVLDQVEATLRVAESDAGQRGEAIRQFPSAPASDPERAASWQQRLERLQEQLQGWPAMLHQADQEAAEADGILQAAEEVLRDWLNAAEAWGQRLANGGSPEV